MVRTAFPDLISPALIREAVAAACGEEPLDLVKRQQNRSRVTYEVTLSNGRRAFLKAETRAPGKSYSLVLEAWALERAAGLGIPVPVPLALDCSESRFPFRWLLLSAVPGISLTEAGLDPDSEASLLRRCGALLVKLHQIGIDGFGHLDDDLYRKTGVVRGSGAVWREYVLGLARADAASVLHAGLLSKGEASGCLAVIEAGMPARPRGCLVHGDFDRSHILVDTATRRLTGIIDFGARESADPEWELSWPAFFDSEDTAEAIMQGYREAGGVLDDDVVDCYVLVRLLWLIRYRYDAGHQEAALAVRQRLRDRLPQLRP